MAEKKFGFRDLRTAAELALAPGIPASVRVGRINLTTILPIPRTGKIGRVVGGIQKAADLAGSAYSAYKQTAQTIKELKAMATEIKQTIKDLDAQAQNLLKGNISITDVQQQANMMLNRGIATGEFFKSSDLVQLSGFKPGPLSPDELKSAKARLDQRRKDLQAMYVRLSKQIMELIKKGPNGPHIRENYDRNATPPPGPTLPLEAQGLETITQCYKDKEKNLVKGVKVAQGKPSFWQRTAFFAKVGLTAASVIKHYKKNPGYNQTLNVLFKDAASLGSGSGGGWSEPMSPPITSPNGVSIQQDASGNKIVQVATPGKEKLEIYHRSGSFTEFHPDGKVVYKATDHAYTISLRNHHVSIDGDCHVHVGGQTTIHSKGDLHLEAEANVYVLAPNGTFGVRAKNIQLNSSEDTTLDGRSVQLPLMTLPPKALVAGFGAGVAPAIDPTRLSAFSPEAGKAFAEATSAFKTVAESAVAESSNAGKTVPNPLSLASSVQKSLTALGKIAKVMAGPALGVAVAALAIKKLTKDEEALLPMESPLTNPLIYHQQTPLASRYRELLFDTPEEVGDAEKYQSHVALRKKLNDLPASYTNRLPGKRTTLTTSIVAPDALPIIDFLDRETFTTSFTPNTKLSASFTVAQLADSLAFPDVANYITNDEVDDETPRPSPQPNPFPPDDPRRPPEL